MKLAFISIDFPPATGGIHTYSFEIAKRLYELCDDFVCIAPQIPNAIEFDKNCDFEIVRIKTNKKLLGPSFIPQALSVLRKRQIDVAFHAQWQSLDVSVLARRLGYVKRIASAAHGTEIIYDAYPKRAIFNRIFKNRRQYLTRKTDVFFPVSQYTSELLHQHLQIPQHKRHVVINGTDPDFFFPIENVDLKQRYNHVGKKIILTTTRLVERKGIDTVLEALPEVIAQVPEAKYLIVGKGPFQPQLQAIVNRLGLENYVDFLGRIPLNQLNEHYNLADVFAMPSKAMQSDVEGFGIVFLEANACAKAVVGARTGGIPDAVLHEKTGLLVDEQNPKMLAKALIRLLKNDEERNQMGQTGRQRVLEEANWTASTQRIYKIISETLQKGMSE